MAKTNREKVNKSTQVPNYGTAVKAEVRAASQEKSKKLDAEIDALSQAMERFRGLL